MSFNLSSSSVASIYQVSSDTLQHATEGRVCVSVQSVYMERYGEIPEQVSDTWEKIDLDGAGSTNTVMLFPAHKLAWLCFQSIHFIHKCTVSCVASMADIFPLQPSCPAKK